MIRPVCAPFLPPALFINDKRVARKRPDLPPVLLLIKNFLFNSVPLCSFSLPFSRKYSLFSLFAFCSTAMPSLQHLLIWLALFINPHGRRLLTLASDLADFPLHSSADLHLMEEVSRRLIEAMKVVARKNSANIASLWKSCFRNICECVQFL